MILVNNKYEREKFFQINLKDLTSTALLYMIFFAETPKMKGEWKWGTKQKTK